MKKFRYNKYPMGIFSITRELFDTEKDKLPYSINQICIVMMKAIDLWKWRLYKDNHFPLVGVYPVKGCVKWKSNRKIHTLLFNGTYNEFISPALCKISMLSNDYFKSRKELLSDITVCPQNVVEVVGQYNLNTKFVSHQELPDMTDAYDVFDIHDKALLALAKDNEAAKNDKLVNVLQSMNSINNHFKMMLGIFFKDFFNIEIPKDNKEPIDYANKVYEIISNAFVIYTKTKEQLKNLDYPVITVAMKPNTLEYLLSHASNKKVIHNHIPVKFLLKQYVITLPIIIAGLHHTVFKEKYMECKLTIMSAKSQQDEEEEIEIPEEAASVIKSW